MNYLFKQSNVFRHILLYDIPQCYQWGGTYGLFRQITKICIKCSFLVTILERMEVLYEVSKKSTKPYTPFRNIKNGKIRDRSVFRAFKLPAETNRTTFVQVRCPACLDK